MLRKTGPKSSIKTRKSGFTRFFGGKKGIGNRKIWFFGFIKNTDPTPKHLQPLEQGQRVAEAGDDWPVKAPGKTAANLGWWKYECNVFPLISGGKR